MTYTEGLPNERLVQRSINDYLADRIDVVRLEKDLDYLILGKGENPYRKIVLDTHEFLVHQSAEPIILENTRYERILFN